MTGLLRSPFKLKHLTAYLVVISAVIFSVFILIKPAVSCDVVVISGKVTTDGRPLLWKNFDCSQYWKQEVKYYPAKSDKAGPYYLLYHNDDSMAAINGSPLMPQSGANAAGFAASVAAVYEDLAPLHESGNLNTDLVQHAVEECATVADWENLLKTWPNSHYNHAISANYVVVDAHGGAALYECYTGKYTHGLLKIQWRRTDANTGEVVDNTGKVITPAQANFPGFVNRTNLNSYVWYNSGVDRYLRAKKLLTQLAQKDPVTGKTQLNAKSLMQVISKDVVGVQYGAGGDSKYSCTYCISRSQTRSGTVFQGVPDGGDPRQTVYWTALGEPSISVYVPNMIGAGSISDYVHMDTVDSSGGMKDTSDASLINNAEDQRETYNSLIHSSNRGSVFTGPYDKYINKIELAKAQQWTFTIENTVIDHVNDLLNGSNSNPELLDAKHLQLFSDYCGKYIYDNYVAGSATAKPWDFVAVAGVTLDKPSLSLGVDDSAVLTAAVAPENASNKAVTWSSTDSNIATVDQNGKVTAIAPGTATITVKNADCAKTADCMVTVYAAGTVPTLNSIAVTTPPDKLVYRVGDTLDITGMVVTGTYSDGSTKKEVITTANVSGFDSSVPTVSQNLTVTVGDKTDTYHILIKALDTIAITSLPNKLVYRVGDPLDLTGMVVTGTYSDGSTEIETVMGINITGFNNSAPALSLTLTVTVGGKTAEFNIVINEETLPDSIAITTLPDKLVYNMGDALDITGMTVTGTYSDSSVKTETVTTANVSGFDSYVPTASQTLTVTVGGKTATYNVEIKATPVGLIKAAIARFTPVSGTVTLTENLPYSSSVKVYKIIVSPANIDANKVESSSLNISTFYTFTTKVPVFPFGELIAGPDTSAESLVSTGVLSEDGDNYIITLTGVDCPQSMLNICNKTDISPLFVMDVSDQKLDCQIKISKATGRIVSVDNIKIIGTTKVLNGSDGQNTIQAASLILSY